MMKNRERIKSRSNPLIRLVARLETDRKFSAQCGKFICDGTKLLTDALACGAEVEAVLAVNELPLPELPGSVRVVSVPEKIMYYISTLVTPPGVMCVCKRPDTALPEGLFAGGRHIILDKLSDPGNMGTIIRTADALGIDSVVLISGSCDPFNPKVVRAAMGSVLRQRIYIADQSAVLAEIERSAVPVFAADNSADALCLRDVSPGDAAVVIGNESSGVSDILLESVKNKIKIPILDRCDSLNAAVAAAIIMWHFNS